MHYLSNRALRVLRDDGHKSTTPEALKEFYDDPERAIRTIGSIPGVGKTTLQELMCYIFGENVLDELEAKNVFHRRFDELLEENRSLRSQLVKAKQSSAHHRKTLQELLAKIPADKL